MTASLKMLVVWNRVEWKTKKLENAKGWDRFWTTSKQNNFRNHDWIIRLARFWANVFYIFTLLQGKNGQNKPENQQNWNMANIAPKSDKFMHCWCHCWLQPGRWWSRGISSPPPDCKIWLRCQPRIMLLLKPYPANTYFPFSWSGNKLESILALNLWHIFSLYIS